MQLTSLFLASASAFFIWFLDTRTTVIAFEALFNFISISGWNAVDVITTESYPATLRSTGYGFLSAISRLAAILGNLTFARFISVSRALPVLTTATVLMVGALASLKLKETKDALIQWTLVGGSKRAISRSRWTDHATEKEEHIDELATPKRVYNSRITTPKVSSKINEM
ncbi:UNVERIFIED_CONTAM: Sv2c [Trichonephila clavipes]